MIVTAGPALGEVVKTCGSACHAKSWCPACEVRRWWTDRAKLVIRLRFCPTPTSCTGSLNPTPS
jgi:hypothetical protein